jgi:hypothetical protein
MLRLARISTHYAVYLILAFPLFYFVYKFGDPLRYAYDFFHYYKLYDSWQWTDVLPPFCLRVVSPFLTYLLHGTGIHYDTSITFDQYAPYGFQRDVFFASVFFNFLTVAGTATIISEILRSHTQQRFLPFIGGLLYLSGFGTIFYHLMPLTEAFSTLVFTAILFCYQRRSWWAFAFILIAALQREYILFAVALIALLDVVQNRSRYNMSVFVLSALLSVGYFLFRKFYFPYHENPRQISVELMVKGLTFPGVAIPTLIKQTVITMNLLALYVFILAYKTLKKMSISRELAVRNLLLLLLAAVLTVLIGLGTNAGRVFYITVPVVVIGIAKEMESLAVRQDPGSQAYSGE